MNNKFVLQTKFSFLPVFLATFFIDQSSKFVVALFGFPITYNFGVSLGILNESHPQLLTFLLGSLVFLLFIKFKRDWKKNPMAAGLFFGGAVANIFDRLFFQAVRDWLFIPFTQIQNNLADWAIFIGLFLIIHSVVKYRYYE